LAQWRTLQCSLLSGTVCHRPSPGWPDWDRHFPWWRSMRDEGAFMYTSASALLRRPLLISWRFATPPISFFVVTWPPFTPSWRLPPVSAWPIFRFPAPVIFCLHSVGARTLEVARFSTAPAFLLSWVPLSGWGRSAPLEYLGASFVGPGD
jgi:hypothetical protein